MKQYDRIRQLRQENGLSCLDIARILGVSITAYTHYEDGRQAIPAEELIVLADYYRVSIDYLLGRTDVKAPYPR